MNEVTKTNDNAMMPFFISDDSGVTGFENLDSDCISIPFLRLAQSNTPQVANPDEKIAGLDAGMYFNPSTGRIYGKEPKFVILAFYRTWNVWNGEPPDAKFVRSLSTEEYLKGYESKTKRDDKGKVVDAEGNRYIDSRNFLLCSADYPEDGILLYPMSSTGIPASKKWLAKATNIRVTTEDGKVVQPPMWSRIWSMKVVFVKGAKGNYYQVNDVLDNGWLPENISGAVREAFLNAQDYDKQRIAQVEHTED